MQNESNYYGHGKLLLTGEYLVMDGALSLALPVSVGQSLKVKTRPSYNPTLNWKSFDHQGQLWFESDFEFWQFNPLKEKKCEIQNYLKKILKQVRFQNPHFLRDDVDVFVETKLEFPIEWGLGSSSTLLYNIAQWAYVSPFELMQKTLGGSGYDIACAQSMGPILYQVKDNKPHWTQINFKPSFDNQLYFLYLGSKQKSSDALEYYHRIDIPNKEELSMEISRLTTEIVKVQNLEYFDYLIREHEKIIASTLKLTRIKEKTFPDFWGEIKSLGAWGGDFCLVTSNRPTQETFSYFQNMGYTTMMSFNEMALGQNSLLDKESYESLSP